MREALQGLTTRGRCFLSAGIAAGLSALVLGQQRPAPGRGPRPRPAAGELPLS